MRAARLRRVSLDRSVTSFATHCAAPPSETLRVMPATTAPSGATSSTGTSARDRALARIEWAKDFIRHDNSQRAFVQKDAAERLRKLERTLKAIRSESSIRARVRTHLEAMFALDQAADLLEAWALNLFDRIEDVTP